MENIGLLGLVFIVFLVLKLTSVIAWSWWWVSLPLWGPFTLIPIFGFAFLVTVVLDKLGD